jgi:hypothetical protein
MIVLASALSILAVAPASAQAPAAPMMQPGAMSCVSGGQFVPCPPGTQMPNPGMGMGTQAGAQPAGAPQPAAQQAQAKGGKAKKGRKSARS